ncbi:MAG: neutral/alkaline non-lysosomal ceramidase N-terminal domain-containing protein [Chitinophagaceae bacterium]|nr:neutral/alkaline non-lysosomal ceramidase N-terminal domain-containing protein [Chitinophagaceae bacterium]
MPDKKNYSSSVISKRRMHHAIRLVVSTLFLSVIFLFFGTGVIASDMLKENQLLVGVARKNITPDKRIKNWVTGKPYTGVEDSIYVRALVLGDGQDKIVIINWSLVDAGESATDEVRKKISAELNIPAHHILVNASHNHSAPWTPVYQAGYRGKERDTWWAIRYMPPQNDDPYFKAWMKFLINQTAAAAKEASQNLQPATLWIGRVNASRYMYNRRPRQPKWGLEESNVPKGYGFSHPDYNPDVLVGGAAFGPMDRTMTLLSFRDAHHNPIVSVFHLAVHAVSIYPYSEAISGDWPEEASKRIGETIGGEAVFLQGNAGDIVPWRRGRVAVTEMGAGLAELASAAYRFSAKLKPASLIATRSMVKLPLSERGKERTGLDSVNAEVQLITYGSLAIVTLPGEPLTGLGNAIRARSPFPQTLVLGYSNGNGVHYVSLPDEKPFGGYEVETGTSGTECAGRVLEEEAVRMLNEAIGRINHEHDAKK